MNQPTDDEEFRELLKEAMPAVADAELRRDLWPDMLKKLDEQPVRVPWFDWALAALLGVALFLFPGAIPAVLYHL
jgi:hypothetical protein